MNELRQRPFHRAPPRARGALKAVGIRVSWRARVTASASTASSPDALRRFSPGQSAFCSFRGAMPPVPGVHLVGTTTASHNMAIDTDAQGRPLGRYAPCAPVRGRRSSPR